MKIRSHFIIALFLSPAKLEVLDSLLGSQKAWISFLMTTSKMLTGAGLYTSFLCTFIHLFFIPKGVNYICTGFTDEGLKA